MPRVKTRKRSLPINELLLRHSTTNNTQDQELLLALQLSKEEQVNQQKKLLKHFSQISGRSGSGSICGSASQSASHSAIRGSSNVGRVTRVNNKQRLIQKDESDNEEDWFQTISNRIQQQKQPQARISKPKKVVKKEKGEILLDIDLEEEELVQCSTCQQKFKNIKHHVTQCAQMISDSDSDCSIIDLVDNNSGNNDTFTTLSSSPPSPVLRQEEEDDDGYLSPLEGFTAINQNDTEFNPYFDHLQRKLPKKKSTSTTKKQKRKPSWFKKKKR